MISKRASNVSESVTLAITAKARKMKEDGRSIIGFGAGEPDFNTPEYILRAAVHALNSGMTKYTPAAGTTSLRKAICKKLMADNNLYYAPAQIVVSNGAKHSLFNAMSALVEQGDEVIIPAPYWVTYPELVKLCDGTPVIVETTKENGFKLTPDQLEDAITDKTKVLILNSPCNPTGVVYTKDELLGLISVLLKYPQVYVISDEIYEKLVYGRAKHWSIASLNDDIKARSVVVNGLSKSYAMTGWRIGYLAAMGDLPKAIAGIQSHESSNPNSIAQYAAEIALTDEDYASDFILEMHATFDARRKTMVARIREIEGVECIEPSGAFYCMVKVSAFFGKKSGRRTMDCARTFADELLDKQGVAVVPGEAFGAPEYVRLSYAISEEDIMEGLHRLEKFIQSLK